MILHAIVNGLLISAVAGGYIVALLRLQPRLFLRNYPPEVRAVVPPLTPKERGAAVLASIPLLAVVVLGPIWSAFDLAARWGSSTTHSAIFWDAFVVGMTFNVVDFVVLDILWLGLNPPRFAQLPGSEAVRPQLHLWPHLRGFAVATFVLLLVSAVATLLVPHL